uniref:Late embryogenesis abundant protein 1-like n=1 Tax=Ananas comosus var. bracteatus TaxID=296719 RepID=A0A6V7NQV9_ANACO|nr:unnamed protein product [Ananas comosus var. bracteatus]
MSNTQQMFKSGKAHGEGAEKAGQWMQSAKDTTKSMADSAQQNKDQAAEKADQWMQSAKDTTNSMGDSAQQNKDQAAGFLQQTGDQVKQMAQGAANAVKNAVGMGNTDTAAGNTTTSTTTTTSKH